MSVRPAFSGAARRNIAVWLSHQRLFPSKARRSILKKLYPQMLKDYAFVRPFFDNSTGLRFSGNISNAIDRQVYFSGVYEKYMLCMLRDYMQALKVQGQGGLTFMDVGANVGNHALFMSRFADQVLAFEPFERVRRQMEANLALNAIANVRVFGFALSDANQTLPFYAAHEGNLGASSFASGHNAQSNYLGDMQLRVGDEVLHDEGVGRIDVLKVDVEGFEKQVLQGLSKTLGKSRPLMVVEFTETTRQSVGDAALFRSLFPEDYNFYYFSRCCPTSGKYQLSAYRYGMTPRNENVVACPQEHSDVLLNAGK